MTSGYWLVKILKTILLMKGYVFNFKSNVVWPLQCAYHISEADNNVLEGICTYNGSNAWCTCTTL